MSEDPSPYAAPAQTTTAPAMPPAVLPGQIKVLGILHLILAGLGIVSILFGLVSTKMTESVFAMQEKAGGAQAIQAQVSRTVVEVSRPITWFTHASALILGVMLLLAGLALLKRKQTGLSWSNRYAWTSISFKIINLILFATILMPKIGGLFSSFETGGPEMRMAGSIMRITTIGSGIAGPLIGCIYPILVLVLLNRDSVKKSLI